MGKDNSFDCIGRADERQICYCVARSFLPIVNLVTKTVLNVSHMCSVVIGRHRATSEYIIHLSFSECKCAMRVYVRLQRDVLPSAGSNKSHKNCPVDSVAHAIYAFAECVRSRFFSSSYISFLWNFAGVFFLLLLVFLLWSVRTSEKFHSKKIKSIGWSKFSSSSSNKKMSRGFALKVN